MVAADRLPIKNEDHRARNNSALGRIRFFFLTFEYLGIRDMRSDSSKRFLSSASDDDDNERLR